MSEQINLPEVSMKPKHAPARPRKKSEAIISKVATKLTRSLGEENYEDIHAALTHEIHDWDGYNLARYLDEELGLDVDSHVVELLNAADIEAAVEYTRAVQDWVRNYELEPKLSVGHTVTIQHNGVTHEGTISRVYAETLSYIVTVPGLGHGVPNKNRIVHGRLFVEEDILPGTKP